MKYKKIAIIGSSSFLVKRLLQILPDELSVDLYGRSYDETVDSKHNFTYFDYPKSEVNFETLLKYDVIILAAATGVQAKEKQETDLIYALNSFFPIKLVNFLSEKNYQGKVFTFGSYFEIGNNSNYKYFNEDEVLKSTLPIPNHYCSSKRILSRFIGNNLNNLLIYHFILPTIYGAGENKNRLVPYLIDSFQNHNKINLTGGDQVRQYLYSDDLGNLILDFVENNYSPGIYNVSASQELTVREIVECVSNHFKIDVEISYGTVSRNDTSMKVLLLNSDKLKTNCSWRPVVQLNDVIEEYLIQLN